MKVSGTFIADGNAINVNIGFIPDYIEAFNLTTGPKALKWHRCVAERDIATAALFKYGIEYDSGADGTLEYCADADDGIIAYDAPDESMSVMIKHPSTGIKEPQSVADWTTVLSDAASARSATAIGTILRPTVHNGYVYECIDATGSASATEPTWGTVPGERTDDGSLGYICRVEEIGSNGGQGFTLGATQSNDSDVWAFKAERHDRTGDMGDAAGAQPTSFRKGA